MALSAETRGKEQPERAGGASDAVERFTQIASRRKHLHLGKRIFIERMTSNTSTGEREYLLNLRCRTVNLRRSQRAPPGNKGLGFGVRGLALIRESTLDFDLGFLTEFMKHLQVVVSSLEPFEVDSSSLDPF